MPSPPYTLRPATAGDAQFVYDLRKAGLRDYVEHIWGWNENVQAARFKESFAASRYHVIVVDGRDVGALSLEWRDREAFLADIEILPEWRGRGLGTAVITGIIAEAQQWDLPTALQVLKVNPARHLYAKLGFSVVEETATHVLMRTADRA